MGRRCGESAYPCIVELGLDSNHVALLLVLRPEDVELGWVERPFVEVSKMQWRERNAHGAELTSPHRWHLIISMSVLLLLGFIRDESL